MNRRVYFVLYRAGSALTLALLTMSLIVSAGLAANPPTFTVTTTDDHDDGVCNAADCSLREAINAGNASSGGSVIQFANGVTGTIKLTQGELAIRKSLTINGPGAKILAVDGNLTNRVFAILPSAPGVSVLMKALTIRNGLATATNGTSAGAGGCIYVSAGLTLVDCAITGGMAAGASNNNAAGGTGVGGGIFVDGAGNNGAASSVALDNCTVSGNARLSAAMVR